MMPEPIASIFIAIFENRLDDVANLAKQGLANAVLDGDSAFIYAIDQKNYHAAIIIFFKTFLTISARSYIAT